MKLSAQVGATEREIVVEAADGGDGKLSIVIDGSARTVDARRVGPATWSLLLGDRVITVDIETGKEGELLVDSAGLAVPVKIVDPRRKLLDGVKLSRPRAAGPTLVTSPMPGKVVKLLIKPDDDVTIGQGLVVVEAMKMENELRAPRAGKVKAVHVREGQAVEGQETLITIE